MARDEGLSALGLPVVNPIQRLELIDVAALDEHVQCPGGGRAKVRTLGNGKNRLDDILGIAVILARLEIVLDEANGPA